MLCDAITKGMLVSLRYEDDFDDRLFEPAAVYFSTQHKVLVSGFQVANPEKLMDANEPHNFEVGKITKLEITAMDRVAPVTFDRNDKKYCNGIICPLEPN
ncbi:hypothetical protein DCO57_11275 [Labrenzia sp. 011]|nr:hypothetical protein DCO57_11275 [Labrenzia sp. 011]